MDDFKPVKGKIKIGTPLCLGNSNDQIYWKLRGIFYFNIWAEYRDLLATITKTKIIFLADFESPYIHVNFFLFLTFID